MNYIVIYFSGLDVKYSPIFETLEQALDFSTGRNGVVYKLEEVTA